MKQIIIISLLVIGIIGGAVLLGGGEDTAEGTASNHFYGQETAEVVITEFGDFECPACAQFYTVFSQVKEAYQDEVRFEYKHFPLVQIHPNAIAAHRAAEAAGNQGKFWEMHDLLYERQNAWRSTGTASNNPAEIFEGYAEELQLDLEQYRTDVRASETISTVNADIAEGRNIGVESTPTFLLNGEIISDINQLATVEGFSSFIDDALAEANGSAGNENAAPDETEGDEAVTKPEDQEADSAN